MARLFVNSPHPPNSPLRLILTIRLLKRSGRTWKPPTKIASPKHSSPSTSSWPETALSDLSKLTLFSKHSKDDHLLDKSTLDFFVIVCSESLSFSVSMRHYFLLPSSVNIIIYAPHTLFFLASTSISLCVLGNVRLIVLFIPRQVTNFNFL